MSEIGSGLAEALYLIATLDPDLIEIIALSLYVSGVAILLSTLIGLPLGTMIASTRFPGRGALVVTLNAFMGLPPVVVGLIVYLLLSRSGPLGVLGLLFTPAAMIVAQIIIAVPIVTSVTRQTITDLWETNRELLVSLGAGRGQQLLTLLWEGRYALVTAVLAGLGRVIGEVGAVMIVGGNIEHATRVLTTAIALETRKGNIGLAIGLGIILITIAIAINAAMHLVGRRSEAPA